nr:HNH endonuclease [Natronocella acetinitrilica]
MIPTCNTPVLALDAGGRPLAWISWQDGVRAIVGERVLWSAGAPVIVARGGDRGGRRSEVAVPAVLALLGLDRGETIARVPRLTNRGLFERDRRLCLYCGERFAAAGLTRDHVHPRARGGPDTWENCVTACMGCNGAKGCRTPEEAGLRLIALPYAPSHAESLVFQNRRILADQMEFLEAFLPKRR